MASIIGFSIVNVKRALLQRSCWVIYVTKGRNLIKGAILSGQMYVQGALLERYSWI